MAENAPETACRRFALWQAVLQLGMSDNPAKFEEAWKTWEHQVDVYEKHATFRLDDDVKISVVLREAPPKLRDKLLVSSQQFESNCKKLRAIINAYLNSNKSWIANYFRNDTKSDPMEVGHTGKRKRQKAKGKRQQAKGKGQGPRAKGQGKSKDNGKGKSKCKGKGAKSDKQDKERHVCGKKEALRARQLGTIKPRQNSERGGRCES